MTIGFYKFTCCLLIITIIIYILLLGDYASYPYRKHIGGSWIKDAKNILYSDGIICAYLRTDDLAIEEIKNNVKNRHIRKSIYINIVVLITNIKIFHW